VRNGSLCGERFWCEVLEEKPGGNLVARVSMTTQSDIPHYSQ
jgi:hypothetical protein